MTNDEKRRSEVERRERAQRARGKVERGSGEELENRKLDQMVSVRLEPDLLAALRELADATGYTLSQLLRQAAVDLIAEKHRRTFAIHVSYVSTGSSPPVTGSKSLTATTASELTEVPGSRGLGSGGATTGSAPLADVDRLTAAIG